MIDKIDRFKIDRAEANARMNGKDDLRVFVETSGEALNQLMDKVDEIIDKLSQLEEGNL